MSQHDFEIANQGFPAFRSDLNDGLQALASNSAGATAPSTTYAYQFWYDSTANLLKMRNTDDDAWITLAFFDQTNDEWEVRSAVIQAVDSAGVTIKDDSGTAILTVSDGGGVDVNGTITSDGADLDGAVVINESGANVDFRVEGDTEANLLFVDASADAVGIGTNSPSHLLHLYSADARSPTILLENNSAGDSDVGIIFAENSENYAYRIGTDDSGNSFRVTYKSGGIDPAPGTDDDRLVLDSSGNLLVGKTSNDNTTVGVALRSGSECSIVRDGNETLLLNRLTSNGDIVVFRKDGSTVGSIQAEQGVSINVNSGQDGSLSRAGTIKFRWGDVAFYPNVDDSYDLGLNVRRFDDVYATNGTIQTSDRNEKQDIEELSEAEQRVAVAAKALLRKFRWKSAVAEKGDDARIHFGIIAQDLQAAFEAEGLDAGRYAMFISSTWWETQTEVPAVEAQDAVYETVVIPAEYDEDGNEITPETTEERLVSEAVEAKEAYTRTDTYDTEEEAPEGAVKRTRMGVRYSELLAFIIAAI